MSGDKNYDQAVRLFEQVHGQGKVQEMVGGLGKISPELARFSVEWIFGEIYADTTLDLKIRELLNLASLVAIGAEPQIKNHIRGALNVGCTEKEIKAAILQMIIIVGFPKVVNAMCICEEIFQLTKEKK
jgi:4-carboxymuconolactone decarboxylase